MENFGATFNDERIENNLNEALYSLCKKLKGIAVERNNALGVGMILNDIDKEINEIFNIEDEERKSSYLREIKK